MDWKGLKVLRTNSVQFQQILNMMFGLVFIPKGYLREVWDDVIVGELMELMENNKVQAKDISKFQKYMEDTYLGRHIFIINANVIVF